MSRHNGSTRIHTIVIGGGQAGLSVGYHLAALGIPFLILDASPRIGDAWRNRWDSLRLFTPAQYAGLPGMPFPARENSFPAKDQVANYLEEYARRFRLPVQSGMSVDRLWKQGGRFQISCGHRRFESENVVVAMSNYQVPRVPAFAHQLSPGIVQLHSYQYRNPSQLQEGGVLVVGVGNSGADIGIEVARTHPTWISGKESGHIPGRIENLVQRKLVVSLLTFTGHHLLTVKTSIGRKLRPRLLHQAGPLIRVKPRDLIHAGIQRVGRTVGVKDGLPLLEGGLVLDVKNVIWCTGYQHGFSWIDLPVLGEASNDEPIHQQGIVKDLPGLYFVGLHFLYALSSATLLGVGRDAERIARAVASRSESESNRVPEATTRIPEGKKQAQVPIPSGEIMMR